MKLLYIACNPSTEDTLMIENEINELTLRISAIPGDHIQSVFLPQCRLEDLPHQISLHRPDILHVAAHGDENELFLATASGDKAPVTSRMLGHFLPADHPPQLIYLNSCNSAPMAKYLSQYSPIVIASSTPISNLAARASAGVFYARLAEGCTVMQAYHAAESLGQSLQPDSAWVLETTPSVVATNIRLCETFKLVARFTGGIPKPLRDGFYELDVGVIGCPANTVQVVLFTTESSFNFGADEFDESVMAFEMAMVARHSINKGTLWFEEEWKTESDFKLFACAVTADGTITTTSSMICDAVDRCHDKTNFLKGKVSQALVQPHLENLRTWDGLSVAAPEKPAQIKKAPTAKKTTKSVVAPKKKKPATK